MLHSFLLPVDGLFHDCIVYLEQSILLPIGENIPLVFLSFYVPVCVYGVGARCTIIHYH